MQLYLTVTSLLWPVPTPCKLQGSKHIPFILEHFISFFSLLLNFIFWLLKQQHFMTYDIFTVKSKCITGKCKLLEVILSLRAHFICSLAQKSQKTLNTSQRIFSVLVLNVFWMHNFPPNFCPLRTPATHPFLSWLLLPIPLGSCTISLSHT